MDTIILDFLMVEEGKIVHVWTTRDEVVESIKEYLCPNSKYVMVAIHEDSEYDEEDE